MSEFVEPLARNDAFVEAVLQGGPIDLPAGMRRALVNASAKVVKVPHLGGYEHFARVAGDPPGEGPVVFRWSARTRVAE